VPSIHEVSLNISNICCCITSISWETEFFYWFLNFIQLQLLIFLLGTGREAGSSSGEG
jgi:hypothetical protein